MIILFIIIWLICSYMSLRMWQNIAASLGRVLIKEWFDIFFIFIVLLSGPIGLLITLFVRDIQ